MYHSSNIFYYMTIIMGADRDWISGRKYAKMKTD
jgi:hypothetical protein